MCVWLGGLTRMEDARHSVRPPLAGEEGDAVARNLARVGACADELRLMGFERDDVLADVGRASGGKGSLARKSSRACLSPAMERVWRGP